MLRTTALRHLFQVFPAGDPEENPARAETPSLEAFGDCHDPQGVLGEADLVAAYRDAHDASDGAPAATGKAGKHERAAKESEVLAPELAGAGGLARETRGEGARSGAPLAYLPVARALQSSPLPSPSRRPLPPTRAEAVLYPPPRRRLPFGGPVWGRYGRWGILLS